MTLLCVQLQQTQKEIGLYSQHFEPEYYQQKYRLRK
jgi:hypothetical protein